MLNACFGLLSEPCSRCFTSGIFMGFGSVKLTLSEASPDTNHSLAAHILFYEMQLWFQSLPLCSALLPCGYLLICPLRELILPKATECKRLYRIAEFLANIPTLVVWPLHRLSFLRCGVFRRLLLIQAFIRSFARKCWSQPGL